MGNDQSRQNAKSQTSNPKIQSPRLGNLSRSLPRIQTKQPSRNRPEASRVNEEKPRIVRVFVSSTFVDMTMEREELVKKVFPQLRSFCSSLNVVFSEVDLRWGVTAEQSQSGLTIQKCLKEVDLCRPYFLCILGERYGWHQQNFEKDGESDELLAKTFSLAAKDPKFAWVDQMRDRSVTELEIRHAVLNPLQKGTGDYSEHSFFYFRHPDFIKRLPIDIQARCTAETPMAREKLDKLKYEIIASGLPGHFNYLSVKTLSQLISSDLINAITIEFPSKSLSIPTTISTQKQQQQQRQQGYYRSHSQSRWSYLPRSDAEIKLDSFCFSEKTTKFLLLLGEPGIGKSSLLKNWYSKKSSNHPISLPNGNFDVIMGRCSFSVNSSSVIQHIVMSIVNQFKIQLGVEENRPHLLDIPQNVFDSAARTKKHFLNSLTLVANRCDKLILLLDGIDEVSDKIEEIISMLLVNSIKNLKVIISCREGISATILKQEISSNYNNFYENKNKNNNANNNTNNNGYDDNNNLIDNYYDELRIESLSQSERKTLVESYLDQFGKKLSDDQTNRLVEAKNTQIPLFLSAICSELRQFGHYEQLDNQIEKYVDSTNPVELYSRILDRWTNDFDENTGVVGLVCSLISVSYEGLNENDLNQLVRDIPESCILPLFAALDDVLIIEENKLTIGHSAFKEAVQLKFLTSPDNLKSIHERLANRFIDRTPTDGKSVIGLLYHLFLSDQFSLLVEKVSDARIFSVAYSHSRIELFRYLYFIQEKNKKFLLHTSTASRGKGELCSHLEKSLLSHMSHLPLHEIHVMLLNIGEALQELGQLYGLDFIYSKLEYISTAYFEENDPNGCYQIAFALKKKSIWLLKLSSWQVQYNKRKVLVEKAIKCIEKSNEILEKNLEKLNSIPIRLGVLTERDQLQNFCLLGYAYHLLNDSEKSKFYSEKTIPLVKFPKLSFENENKEEIQIRNWLINQIIFIHSWYRHDYGISLITKLLSETETDDPNKMLLYKMNLEQFKIWLTNKIPKKVQSDPVLRQKLRIQAIYNNSKSKIYQFKNSVSLAEKTYKESENGKQLEKLEEDIPKKLKMIEGINKFILENSSSSEKVEGVKKKKEIAETELFELKIKQEELKKNCPELDAYLEIKAQQKIFEQDIGLTIEEERLKTLSRFQGRMSLTHGFRFEVAVREIIFSHISKVLNIDLTESKIELLSNVTIGVKEIDFLLVERLEEVDGVISVNILAEVEAKSNLNDLAHGFYQSQHFLNWMTQRKDKYDSSQFKSKVYPTGHFETPILHKNVVDNKVYSIGPKSFKLWEYDDTLTQGYFLDRFFIISNFRNLETGLSSDVEASLWAKVGSGATENESKIESLLNFLKENSLKKNTENVLNIYKETQKWVDRLIFVFPHKIIDSNDNDNNPEF